MPRLESITVSHSILSLTCDRNKAVLKATSSPARAALQLLAALAAAAAAAATAAAALLGSAHRESTRVAPAGSARLRGTRRSRLVRSQTCPRRHSRLFPGVFTAIFSSSRNVGLDYLYYTVNKKCMT